MQGGKICENKGGVHYAPRPAVGWDIHGDTTEESSPCFLYVPAMPKLDIIFKNFFEARSKEAPATEVVAGALN